MWSSLNQQENFLQRLLNIYIKTKIEKKSTILMASDLFWAFPRLEVGSEIATYLLATISTRFEKIKLGFIKFSHVFETCLYWNGQKRVLVTNQKTPIKSFHESWIMTLLNSQDNLTQWCYASFARRPSTTLNSTSMCDILVRIYVGLS